MNSEKSEAAGFVEQWRTVLAAVDCRRLHGKKTGATPRTRKEAGLCAGRVLARVSAHPAQQPASKGMSSTAFSHKAKRAEEARTLRAKEQELGTWVAHQEIRFHEERRYVKRIGVTRLILVDADARDPRLGRIFIEARSPKFTVETLILFALAPALGAALLTGGLLGSFMAGLWVGPVVFVFSIIAQRLLARPQVLRLETTLQEWRNGWSAVAGVKDAIAEEQVMVNGQDVTALRVRKAMRRLDRTVEFKGRSTLMELELRRKAVRRGA